MSNRDLCGLNGSITYTTLTSGTDAPTVANVVFTRGNIQRRTATTTRPGSFAARKTVGEWNGGGVLRVIATDDATPPLITTTQGILNIFLDGTQKITVPIVFVGIGGVGYNSLQGETPQFWDYTWEVSATAAATTVTRTA